MNRSPTLRAAALTTIVVAAAAGCVSTTFPAPAPAAEPALTLPAELRVRSAGRIVAVPVEDYVLGTTLSEVSPVGETPDTVAGIFRLQAIIARTYAISSLNRHAQEGFDLCDSAHCQLYEPDRLRTSRFAGTARRAVVDTEGQVLAYSRRVAEALFHSDCGGHTAAAETIWGQAVSYLSGAPDAVPDGTHRLWQVTLTREQLRRALNSSPASAVGEHLRGIRIIERDASGRAARIEVHGDAVKVLRGEQLRSALNQVHGPTAIRSTKFTLTLDNDAYRFDGTGFGHGVGLCQVGAAARIRRGDSIPSVLAAYYPGTRLTRAAPSR